MSTSLSPQSRETPLEHGADIGLHQSTLPSTEQARALAMQAALSSRIESQQPREYSPLEKISLFGRSVVMMRRVESSDREEATLNEQRLTNEMQGVFSRD